MASGAVMGGLSGGLGGAGMGFMMGGPVGAAIGGGVGLLGGIFGGMGADSQADAAQQIAMAQMQEQQRTRGLAMGAAQPSVEELQMMQSELSNWQRMNSFHASELERTQKTLNAIDPNIMESANQLHSLMTGGESASLNPLKSQRARERQSLESNLRNTMGAGYMSSTAGQQALAQHDQQTDEMMTTARFGAMNQMAALGQSQAGTSATVGGSMRATGGLLASMGNEYMGQNSSMVNRQIAAINATPTTPYAGAASTGQYLQGGQQAQFGQQLLNTGATMGMMGMAKQMPNTLGEGTSYTTGLSGGYVPGRANLGYGLHY